MSQSQAWFSRAEKCFPGGVNSPVRAFGSVGGTPIVFERGEGKHLWDVDGKKYVDFCASWGPLILGYSHPEVVNAVQQQAAKALTFGAPCKEEVLLAEKVKSWIPGIEKLRFVSSGTEATMSALRVARAFTKRDRVIKFVGCYHGHADAFLIAAGSGLATFQTSSSQGVPMDAVKHTITCEYNDIDFLKQLPDNVTQEIAAVIIEPLACNMGLVKPTPEFMQFLRSWTKQIGALFIFDEVMTGFRLAKGGAAEHFKTQPDLWTFGKIIGGGLPAAAFGGREEIMNVLSPLGGCYQAGTLSGNPMAMAAGLATLNAMEKQNTFSACESLGKHLDMVVQEILSSHISSGKLSYVRQASFFCFFFGRSSLPQNFKEVQQSNMQTFSKVYHHLLNAGIYLGPSGYEVGFISNAHEKSDCENLVQEIAKALK